MLQLLLHIIFISCCSIVCGFPLYRWLHKEEQQASLQTFSFSFFYGIILLALYASIIVLAAPLSFWLLIFPVVAGSIASFISLKRKNIFFNFKFSASVIPLLSLLLLFVFLGSNQPAMEDTDLYHVQLIRWDEQYGTVPGLANLYLRYGFYSNWFHLIALFDLPFHQQNFLYLNVTFSCWISIYFFYKIIFLSNKKENTAIVSAVLYFLCFAYMLFEWDLLRAAASSTSYDFVVTSFILIALLLIVERLLFITEETTTITLFAVSACSFKLTGAFLIPLLLLFFVFTKRKTATWLLTAILGIAFITPMLIKNYFQSGYFVFPYTLFNSNAAWQVPENLITQFNSYISLGNKYINQEIPWQVWESKNNLPANWIVQWFTHLTYTDKFLICAALLSFLLSFSVKELRKNKNLWLLYLSTFILLPVWLFLSPDPRFFYGILLLQAFLPISFLIKNYVTKIPFKKIVWILIPCVIFYMYNKRALLSKENFILPTAIIVPPTEKIKIGTTDFFIPEKINNNWNIRCYDCPLPCIYQLNPYLEPRGKTIKDGFIMKPISDSSFILHYNY